MLPPASIRAAARFVAFGGGPAGASDRAVAAEVPVNVIYASVPFAVMMMTPSDLHDFAVGFSLTEGVIEAAEEVRGVAVQEEAPGLRLLVDLAPRCLHAHLARRRTLSGRTGCGVCGIDDMADIPLARRR